MKRLDYAKAFAGGAVALALNIVTLVLLVFGYAHLVEPGQTPEFYGRAAPGIGHFSGPIGGATIMFLLVWAPSRRKPSRNAYAFAGAMLASYVVLDVALGLTTTSAPELFRLPLALGIASTGAAAFAAAYLSGMTRKPSIQKGLNDRS